MADKTVEKLKEQCLELILNVMPISQLAFVFLMAVIIDRLGNKNGVSPLSALSQLGLESFFSVKGGLFWSVGILVLGTTFFLALFNTFILKQGLRYSFANSRVSEKLSTWATAAHESVKTLSSDEKLAIQKSIGGELEKRLKKYQAKRMLAESMYSLVSCILFGSLYLALISYPNWDLLHLSLVDLAVLGLGLVALFTLHRSSVRYAVSKIIPLQIYLSAATGEIAFFIDID